MSTLDFSTVFAKYDFHDTYFMKAFNKQMNDQVMEEARKDMQERYDNRKYKGIRLMYMTRITDFPFTEVLRLLNPPSPRSLARGYESGEWYDDSVEIFSAQRVLLRARYMHHIDIRYDSEEKEESDGEESEEEKSPLDESEEDLIRKIVKNKHKQ
jgi:hypothetical protein